MSKDNKVKLLLSIECDEETKDRLTRVILLGDGSIAKGIVATGISTFNAEEMLSVFNKNLRDAIVNTSAQAVTEARFRLESIWTKP